MAFKYDLHCHTQEGSACSHFPAEEMAAFYQRQGFAGFCITDHFTGSTPFPRNMPWDERIDQFYACYEKAKKAAEGMDLSVFFGMEYSLLRCGLEAFPSCTGNDFLIFGLTPQWLKANRAAFALPHSEFFDEAHKAGATIIHAHPFLEAYWVDHIHLFPRKVDAIEGYNAPSSPFINEAAQWYAGYYNLPLTGGSDIHDAGAGKLGGVETEEKCETLEQLMQEIRSGRAVPFMQDAIL